MDLVLAISEVFSQRPEMMTFNDLKTKNLQGWHFVDLNDSCFYYGDSYLTHLCYSLGALDLTETPSTQREFMNFPLSFNHELSIEIPEANEAADTQALTIRKALAHYRQEKYLANEENTHFPNRYCFDEKLCSRSFEDFTTDIHENFIRKQKSEWCMGPELPKVNFQLG